MNLIDKLERSIGSHAIPNLTRVLVAGQAIAFILTMSRPEYNLKFSLVGAKVLEAEIWRLLTFLFFPIEGSIIFVAFGLILLYIYGNALESHWGTARYNLYILFSYTLTIIVAFIFPSYTMLNIYLYASIFLGFAFLFPNFTLMLFFVFPLKIKWLAYLTWFGFAVSFVTGSIATRAQIAIVTLVFVLFFYEELKHAIRIKLLEQRSIAKIAKSKKISKKYLHKCSVCGKTEVTDPDMEIRYCDKCIPERCYCGKHIHNHKHKVVN